MARRLATLLLLLPVLLAAPLKVWLRPDPVPAGCRPLPLGEPPRHWLACAPAVSATGAGPTAGTRPLADEERLLLGMPLDLNSASPVALAFVPGLSRRLGVAVAAYRTNRGPFESVEDLRRVGGIGEKRLALARGRLFVGPP
jgi:competence protein ComEA